MTIKTKVQISYKVFFLPKTIWNVPPDPIVFCGMFDSREDFERQMKNGHINFNHPVKHYVVLEVKEIDG